MPHWSTGNGSVGGGSATNSSSRRRRAGSRRRTRCGRNDSCRLVPEQHVDLRRLEPLDARDLLAVEAELQDVGGLRVPGELRVERLVAPRAERRRRLDAHQEVGVTAPAVAREDALVDDVDAGAHRGDRLARGALPVASSSSIVGDGRCPASRRRSRYACSCSSPLRKTSSACSSRRPAWRASSPRPGATGW